MLLSNDRAMADEDLVKAERLLDKYVEENKCGWCRKQGRKIRDAAKELRAASPAALGITKRFQDEVGDTAALDSLDSQKKELSEAAERNKGFVDRLDKVLEGPREKVQERRPFGPRKQRQAAEPLTERRGLRNLPGLPEFVTPDEVGSKRDAEMEAFRAKSNRRTGPIREKIRFRLSKRIGD
jgi:hypothetical protein